MYQILYQEITRKSQKRSFLTFVKGSRGKMGIFHAACVTYSHEPVTQKTTKLSRETSSAKIIKSPLFHNKRLDEVVKFETEKLKTESPPPYKYI